MLLKNGCNEAVEEHQLRLPSITEILDALNGSDF
jgi:hypothetical protein